jgi:hypothetical protein
LVLPPNSTPETQADFDSLIDLLTSTIKPATWEDVGGPGSIKPFETNLSITVSQTQEMHEEIEEALARLRKLGGGAIPPHAQRAAGAAEAQSPGGGMGGMGGMGGNAAGRSYAPPTQAPPPAAKPQQADLLQGVRSKNSGNQSIQSEKLQQMYKSGKGGVDAGGAF